jgi:hypothetical protein
MRRVLRAALALWRRVLVDPSVPTRDANAQSMNRVLSERLRECGSVQLSVTEKQWRRLESIILLYKEALSVKRWRRAVLLVRLYSKLMLSSFRHRWMMEVFIFYVLETPLVIYPSYVGADVVELVFVPKGSGYTTPTPPVTDNRFSVRENFGSARADDPS